MALAGAGAWGMNLARNVASLPECRLLWICDPDPKALARAAAQIQGARPAATLLEALEDTRVEAVVVSASAAAHHALAREALDGGRDVFVEKPMALTIDDAADLVDRAESGRRILMAGHLLLYHPAVRKMKSLIESGDLGRVHYVYSQRVNLGTIRRDENALWSFAPHDISVMNHFLDGVPEDVSARGQAYVQPGIVDVEHVMVGGRTIRGIIMGDAKADVFLPKLVELFMKGRFPIDRMVTFYPFAEINRAVDDALSGRTVKPILRF